MNLHAHGLATTEEQVLYECDSCGAQIKEFRIRGFSMLCPECGQIL